MSRDVRKPKCSGFRPGPTQTRLYSYRRWLEALNFGFRNKRDCTICVAKTKALSSFAVISGTSPDYMGEHFIPASSLHNYSTRFRENGNFLYPKVKGFGRKSFAFTGCSLWNRLPPNVKNVNELKPFKTAVKSHLFNSV